MGDETFSNGAVGIQADSNLGRKTSLDQIVKHKIVLEKYFLNFPS